MLTDPPADVRGVDLDRESRCAHYHGANDIVAIRMRCCGAYYACYECHEALAGHRADRWPPEEWHTRAVRCGACRQQLSIRDYFASGFACPACGAPFNPGCRNHYPLYFVIPNTSSDPSTAEST